MNKKDNVVRVGDKVQIAYPYGAKYMTVTKISFEDNVEGEITGTTPEGEIVTVYGFEILAKV